MSNLFEYMNENKGIFEEIHNAIIVIDKEGTVVNINQRATELLGIDMDQALNHYILDVYAESMLTEVTKTLRASRNINIEINGKHCITSRMPLFDEGRPIGAMAIFDDVSKFDALNQKLEAERGEMVILKSILELAYDGILVVDTNGYIKMISNAYKRFLGVEGDEVIGKHVTEIIQNTRMHIVAQTGVPEINDFQEIRGDYMVATRIPYYVDGKLAGAIGKVIFRNVSKS